MGVFSFLFLYVHTNSLTPPLFFLSHPSLRRERELLLGCSWCKSPAQTTRACQQSVADSSNPLFAVVLSRASLSQGSGSRRTANVHRLCSETHREHLHYVSSEPVTYIMVRWWGGALMHTLFQQGFEGVLPDRRLRKESISVERLMCIHLLICCFYGETSLFFSSRTSLSLFLSPSLSLSVSLVFLFFLSLISNLNLHVSYFGALISSVHGSSSCESLRTAGGYHHY